MRHLADVDFWKCYEALPVDVRRQADATYERLKQDPHHPSLRFKKIGQRWSVRVGKSYRALALEVDEGFLWYWIGSHADYNRLIR